MAAYEYEHSVRTSADADTVWRLWQDAADWPAWDTSVTAVELTGPFAEGTTGTMHVVGQDPVAFTLVDVTPGVGFVDETEIPGGVLRFGHVVTPLPDGGATVTHRVQIDGPAALAAEFGPMVTEDVPAALAGLVALAERSVSDRASSVA